jgi:DNA-binding beta-propeller fold protein YncE
MWGGRFASLASNAKTNTIVMVDQARGALVVFDAETNKVDSAIKVKSNPNGVMVNPENNIVYVANQDDDSISVISVTRKAVP